MTTFPIPTSETKMTSAKITSFLSEIYQYSINKMQFPRWLDNIELFTFEIYSSWNPTTKKLLVLTELIKDFALKR